MLTGIVSYGRTSRRIDKQLCLRVVSDKTRRRRTSKSRRRRPTSDCWAHEYPGQRWGWGSGADGRCEYQTDSACLRAHARRTWTNNRWRRSDGGPTASSVTARRPSSSDVRGSVRICRPHHELNATPRHAPVWRNTRAHAFMLV